MAKLMTIPEAFAHRRDFPKKLKDLYTYANAVMESWDGPAAICGCHDQWAIAGMDSRKENRAADTRFKPISSATVIVIPERDVPGIRANI